MGKSKLNYKITLYALGRYPSIKISKKQFDEIRAAKRKILFGLGLEEKFDLVLENFADFERTLLELALQHSIFSGKVHSLMDDASHVLNRRLANFLTTARLYLDQICHELSASFGNNSEAYLAVQRARSAEYDSVLGYRAMESLRNHAQHRSLPVHGITFGGFLDESDDPPHFGFHVRPSTNVDNLAEDPKFKRELLAELKEHADKDQHVDLVPLVREYTESLGRIHEEVRRFTDSEVEGAEQLVLALRERYRKKSKEMAGVAAVACDENGLYPDHEYLMDRLIVRRRDLRKKNRSVKSLSRRFVSSRSGGSRKRK